MRPHRPNFGPLGESIQLLIWGIVRRFLLWAPFLFLDVFDIYEQYISSWLPSDWRANVSAAPDPSFILLVLGLAWAGVLTYHELRVSGAGALPGTPEPTPPAEPPTLTHGRIEWIGASPENKDEDRISVLQVDVGIGTSATQTSVMNLRLKIEGIGDWFPRDPPPRNRGGVTVLPDRSISDMHGTTWLSFPVALAPDTSVLGQVQFPLNPDPVTQADIERKSVRLIAMLADGTEVECAVPNYARP